MKSFSHVRRRWHPQQGITHATSRSSRSALATEWTTSPAPRVAPSYNGHFLHVEVSGRALYARACGCWQTRRLRCLQVM